MSCATAGDTAAARAVPTPAATVARRTQRPIFDVFKSCCLGGRASSPSPVRGCRRRISVVRASRCGGARGARVAAARAQARHAARSVRRLGNGTGSAIGIIGSRCRGAIIGRPRRGFRRARFGRPWDGATPLPGVAPSRRDSGRHWRRSARPPRRRAGGGGARTRALGLRRAGARDLAFARLRPRLRRRRLRLHARRVRRQGRRADRPWTRLGTHFWTRLGAHVRTRLGARISRARLRAHFRAPRRQRRRFRLVVPRRRLFHGHRLLTRRRTHRRRRRRGRRFGLQRPHIAFVRRHGARQRASGCGGRPAASRVARAARRARYWLRPRRRSGRRSSADARHCRGGSGSAGAGRRRPRHRSPRGGAGGRATRTRPGARAPNRRTRKAVSADQREHDDECEEESHRERHVRAK